MATTTSMVLLHRAGGFQDQSSIVQTQLFFKIHKHGPCNFNSSYIRSLSQTVLTATTELTAPRHVDTVPAMRPAIKQTDTALVPVTATTHHRFASHVSTAKLSTHARQNSGP